jgi:hypothetical protein
MILSGPRPLAADPHGSALTQSSRQSLVDVDVLVVVEDDAVVVAPDVVDVATDDVEARLVELARGLVVAPEIEVVDDVDVDGLVDAGVVVVSPKVELATTEEVAASVVAFCACPIDWTDATERPVTNTPTETAAVRTKRDNIMTPLPAKSANQTCSARRSNTVSPILTKANKHAQYSFITPRLKTATRRKRNT